MIEILLDETDVVARELAPHVVTISKKAVDDLSLKDQRKAEKMIALLDGFNGEFNKESVGASVYSYWQIFFYKSLFYT